MPGLERAGVAIGGEPKRFLTASRAGPGPGPGVRPRGRAGSLERMLVTPRALTGAALVLGHRPQRRAGQPLIRHLQVPLIAQVRLDRHVTAVAMTHAMRVGLDIFEQVVGAEPIDDRLARFVAVHAQQRFEKLIVAGPAPFFHRPAVVFADRTIGRHDVDDRQVVALADLVVVRIVGGGDLQEAAGELGLLVARFGVGHDDVVVVDDGDHAVDDGQADVPADEVGPGRVVGIHRDRGVAEHGFGTGGGDGDELFVASSLRRFVAHQWVFHVPEMPVDRVHLDFIVGQGGLGRWIPVDQAFAAVDQAILEQLEERLAHGPGADFVHRERLSLPVARAAHGLELVGDDLFVLVLPGLDFFDELLAAVLPAGFHLLVLGQCGLALGLEAFVHDGLRGDARVVGARQPDGVVPGHAPPAHQHVLQRVVQGVAQVQRGGDVGRGDDDAVRIAGRGRVGVKGVGGLPLPPDLRLHVAGVVLAGEGRITHHGGSEWERRRRSGRSADFGSATVANCPPTGPTGTLGPWPFDS